MAESSSGRHKQQSCADSCVICLENISERAVAVPCNHCTFDFLCLVSWLQDHQTCPLCKTKLSAVEYDWRSPVDFATYHIRTDESCPKSYDHTIISTRFQLLRESRRRSRALRQSVLNDPNAQQKAIISRRRQIYREQLYSLHVGTNRISRFTDVTPEIFSSNPDLQSRARMWIRRELRVFTFLDPDCEGQGNAMRRASNAEFLLSYVIALLCTVDVRSSSGKAEAKLADFLGIENSRLFLHDLGAWLRSPYTRLEDWDRAAQYADGLSGNAVPYMNRRQRVSAPEPSGNLHIDSNHTMCQDQARQRYQPGETGRAHA